MAWVWPEQYVAANEAADPRDPMRNVNAFAREWNGLWDGDNVPDGIITASKLATKALIDVDSSPSDTATAVPALTTAGWKTHASQTVTTYDGLLRVIGCVHWDWDIAGSTPDHNDAIYWRLVINGEARAHSGWFHVAREKTSCRLVGSAPVMAGSAAVALQYNVYAHPRQLITDANNGTNLASFYSGNPNYITCPLSINKHNILYEMRKA